MRRAQAPLTWNTYPLRIDLRLVEGGIWVAHCLELNAFAEAGSYTIAVQRIGNVAGEMIQHALAEGFDPFGLPAPAEDFAAFQELVEASTSAGRPVLEALAEPPDGVRRVLLDLRLQVPVFASKAPEVWRDLPLPPPHVCRQLLATTGTHRAVTH